MGIFFALAIPVIVGIHIAMVIRDERRWRRERAQRRQELDQLERDRTQIAAPTLPTGGGALFTDEYMRYMAVLRNTPRPQPTASMMNAMQMFATSVPVPEPTPSLPPTLDDLAATAEHDPERWKLSLDQPTPPAPNRKIVFYQSDFV